MHNCTNIKFLEYIHGRRHRTVNFARGNNACYLLWKPLFILQHDSGVVSVDYMCVGSKLLMLSRPASGSRYRWTGSWIAHHWNMSHILILFTGGLPLLFSSSVHLDHRWHLRWEKMTGPRQTNWNYLLKIWKLKINVSVAMKFLG